MSKKKRPGRQPGKPQPQWQPISMLPTFAHHIDGMLAADVEQYEVLLEAKPKPYALDDYTVSRVISAFTTQRDDFPLFDRQLQLVNKVTSEQILGRRVNNQRDE